MRLNPIARWRQRRDERDVHIHPDTGSIPAPTRHPAQVHGAREALAQIRAEAPAVQPPVAAAEVGHRYLPSTAAELRSYAEKRLALAADVEAEARDAEIKAAELRDWAARYRAEADDHFHAAALVELDSIAQDMRPAPQGPAMGVDELLPEPFADGLVDLASMRLPGAQQLDGLRLPGPDPVLAARTQEGVDALYREDPDPLAGERAQVRRENAAEVAAPMTRPFSWLPEYFPADVSGAGSGGDTQTLPVYPTGGAR